VRGGSHGDWNRFLCSQILGAERDTVLPGGRQPSVSSSKPSKTTPGGMLPGGVAVAVAASPWGLRTPGWALPCDYWHGRSRGTGCTFEARRGSGGLLLAPGARRPTNAFEALGNASAWGVRRSRGRRVHPSPRLDVRRSQRGRHTGPAGGRKAGGGMY